MRHWWCPSGSGSDGMGTTQAMKYYNPEDLNLHPYFSIDIVVETTWGGNEQLLELADTCIDWHSNGKEVYLWNAVFPPVLHTCAICNTHSLCFTEMMSLMYPNVTVNTNLNQHSNYHECTTICTTDNSITHLFDIHLLQAGGSNTLYKINLPKNERDCVVSVCLSVCMYALNSHWTGFHESWYWALPWKFVEIIPIWLKSGKILGVVHGPQDIYNDTSNIKLFHNCNVNQCCVSMATPPMYISLPAT